MNKLEYIHNNRKEFLKNLPNTASAVIIAGNGLLSRNADTTLPFRQDSSVLYLSGLKKPNSALLFDIRANRSYIVKPKQTKVEAIFDDNDDWAAACKASGFDDVLEDKQAQLLIDKLAKRGKVYFNLAPSTIRHGVYANPHRMYWQKKLRRQSIEINDIRPILARQRMVKNEFEIKAIQKAVQVTNNALQPYVDGLLKYNTQSEQGIAQDITAQFYARGFEHAYSPIVATAGNAAVLHHLPDSSKIVQNSVLLFDIGAEYDGYAADISRTVIVGHNQKQQSIIDDVTAVQQQLITMLKPGIVWKELQEQSKELLAEVANKHDLIRRFPIDQLFPHSIGHFLGLDVHDAGDYSVPLQENMVITVEPGLYSKPAGLGVRVEDDVLITNNGAKIIN